LKVYALRAPEFLKMKQYRRKVLLVSLAVCFALAATNIMLAVHLQQHRHDKSHNHDDCPLCRESVINKHYTTAEFAIKICWFNEITFTTTSYNNCFFPWLIKYQLPPLRAPPAAC
jgi:hypothetical protein